MQLVRGKARNRIDISQHEVRVIFSAFEFQVQCVPDLTVRAIASNNKGREDLERFALMFHGGTYGVVPLFRGDESCIVLNSSPLPLEHPDEHALGDVLRNHRDERIGAILRFKYVP